MREKSSTPFIRVPLSRGKVALIDAADADLVLSTRWHANRGHKTWYVRGYPVVDGRRTWPAVTLHRFLLDADPDEEVDHWNLNGLDNRRANLRRCSRQQNMWNRSKRRNCTSQYIGVSWNKFHRKWRAEARVGGKRKHLGLFEGEIDAARAYDAFVRESRDDFVRTNFPE